MSVAPMPVSTPLPAALAGRTVLVIGGSSGIGLAAGELLRSLGARVVLVARDKARLDAAVARCLAVPGATHDDPVLGIAADAGDELELDRVFQQAGPIDHVLVTAGGFQVGPLDATPRADVQDAVDSRLWGAYAVARAAAPRLPAGGSITFTSGLYATRPLPGMAAAVAAIGAVEALTKALAVELAPRRVRVNAVRYGVFDTPLARGALGAATDEAVAEAGRAFLPGRLGTPAEAAAAPIFLMSDNYVSGAVIPVDGGQSLV
ncbi:SDR family NAD(P)-dependent oxidoreductase [Nonomuraea sp. NPDC003214]